MIKTTVEVELTLLCGECGEQVYTCDSCQDYFEAEIGEIVYCGVHTGENHYCKECKKA